MSRPSVISRMHLPRRTLISIAVLVAVSGTALPIAAQAQSPVRASESRSFSIAAGSLGPALEQFSRMAGVNISYDAQLVSGKKTQGLSGSHSVAAGLRMLLVGSETDAVEQPGGGFVLRKSAAIDDGKTSILPMVTVTGTSVGDLPQSFAGGQVAQGGRVGMLGNKNLMETPFNVANYTSELIENQQAITIADVMANDPSVRVSSYGLTNAAGAGDAFMIRGFSARTLAFDGVYGIAPIRTFPVEVAERVEVLKGPNALLNGMAPNGEVGGAINITPKRAADEPLTRVTATVASGGLGGTHLDIGRRFGDDHEWGVRFNGVYRNGDTVTDGQSVELGVAAIGIDYRGKGWRASLDAGSQHSDTDAPNGAAGLGVDTSIGIPKPPNAKKQIVQDWEFSKTKSDYLLAKLEYDLTPDWTLYGAAGGSNNRFQYLSTDIFVLDTQGNAQATAYYWPDYWNYRSVQGGLRGTLHTGEIRHDINVNVSVLKQEHGYTTDYYGFTSFNTNIYNAGAVPKPSLAGFSSSPPKTDSLTLPTLAIADTISFLDGRVAVTVGARRQQVQLDTYNASTGARTRAYDESAVTPMAAVLVKLQDNVSLYGNYIQGLSQGPTAPAGTTNAGQIFPPIKTKQVEAGVKMDFGGFAATTSIFQIEKPSAMRVLDINSGTSTYVTSGEQRNRGVELNVFGELAKRVRVLGGVTYTDATLTRTADGKNDGMTAAGVPRWLVNIGGEWDPAAVAGLTFSARMLATSSQHLDAENTASIPGWARWDLGARYKTKALGRPLVIRANIENLFGRDYWASADGNWLTLGAPRTMTLSASMDF